MCCSREFRGETESSWVSRLFFSWVFPLMLTGYHVQLGEEHIGNISNFDSTENNFRKLEVEWNKEVGRHGENASLWRVLIKAFGLYMIPALVCNLTYSTLSFVGPIGLGYLLEWFQDPRQETWGVPRGYLIGVAILLITVLKDVLAHWHHHLVIRTGLRFRNAMQHLIFEKATRVRPSLLSDVQVPQAVTLQMVDSEMIMLLFWFVLHTFAVPLLVGLSIFLLHEEIGQGAYVALGVFCVLVPLTYKITSRLKVLAKKAMGFTDERISAVKEVLTGIRLIKTSAFEEFFLSRIHNARDVEIKHKMGIAILNGSNTGLSESAPIFIAMFAFLVKATTNEDGPLTPSQAFSSLAVIGLLRIPLFTVPLLARTFAMAFASVNRIRKFLLLEDLEDYVEMLPRGSDLAFKLENATLGFDRKTPFFENANVDIPLGKLTAIVGGVGKGKSSLIEAILGGLHKFDGTVAKSDASIAYCAQTSFIFNDTVQQNILFGLPMDREWYNHVLWATALEADLRVLPANDQTEIGERGVNLSGGQKARVSLARCLYRKSAEIYILDDVLSALDAHVSKHVLRNGILPLARKRGKTCILTTHKEEIARYANRLIRVLSLDESKSTRTLQVSDQDPYEDDNDDVDQVSEVLAKVIEPVDLKRGKLVEQEFREYGSIRKQVLLQYAKAVGKFGSFLVISLLLGQNLFRIGTDFWLARWSSSADEPEEDRTSIFFAGIYSALSLVTVVFVFSFAIGFSVVSLLGARKLHRRAVERVMFARMEFFDTTPSGRILNRFSNDVNEMDVKLPTEMLGFFNTLGLIVFAFIVQAIILPWMVLVYFVVGVIYFALMEFYRRTFRELNRLDQITKSPIPSSLQSAITGISTIRAYGDTHRFTEQNVNHINHNAHVFFIKNSVNRYLGMRLDWLGAIITFFVIILSVVQRNSIDPALAGLVITYALNVTNLLNWMVRHAINTEASLNSVERITELANLENTEDSRDNNDDTKATKQNGKLQPSSDTPPNWPQRGMIKFAAVKMRYRQNLPLVLDDINIEFEPGKFVGVCGRSGSGKSSLLSCLFRLVELDSGAIYIDEIDIATVNLQYLRSRLAYVPQDPLLFSGTIRHNLDPVKQYSNDELDQALQTVHLSQRLSNSGLDTQVEQNGSNFSAGERQLLCFARAVLKRQVIKILILDEASSSLDHETDVLMQQGVSQLFPHTTRLVIAHRLATIMNADKIIVLDNGAIKETGSPQHLLDDADSEFYSLVHAAQQTSNLST